MNEQKILLIVLVAAVAVTIGLYVLKAIKQVRYRNDERWNQIQLRVIQIADIITRTSCRKKKETTSWRMCYNAHHRTIGSDHT